jgi:tRNA U34 2-thiouridine synthase MnmA/TrmU
MNAGIRRESEFTTKDTRNTRIRNSNSTQRHKGTKESGVSSGERQAAGDKRVKAVGLLSGGLDSILACRMMMEQGIEVIAVNFTSPFCTCTRKGCRHQASKVADELGIELKLLPTGQDYIEMVKHPKHGRGSHMNPCIDCRIFEFTRARKFADEIGADFVFSGEVLGERPMSQYLKAMLVIEQESGLAGRIVRPLSANLLEPTIPEQQGLVDRSKLKSIQGRSRQPQIAMTREYGMTDYPCPAGGCLLTDAQFAARLKDAFEHGEDTVAEMQFLKVGRHFRLKRGAKVIVGRNEAENRVMESLVGPDDRVLTALETEGPTVVLRRLRGHEDIEPAARLCARYCDAHAQELVKVECLGEVMLVAAMQEPELSELRVGRN